MSYYFDWLDLLKIMTPLQRLKALVNISTLINGSEIKDVLHRYQSFSIYA